jgi:hypothetical protein
MLVGPPETMDKESQSVPRDKSTPQGPTCLLIFPQNNFKPFQTFRLNLLPSKMASTPSNARRRNPKLGMTMIAEWKQEYGFSHRYVPYSFFCAVAFEVILTVIGS